MRSIVCSWVTLAAVTAVAAASACKREEPPEVQPAAGAAIDAGGAPDHLAPGELVEGTEKAFGLTLPKRVRVDHAFADVVYASSDARPDELANYVRARVSMGTVRVGAASTIFEKVQVPAAPGREISIRVAPSEDGRGSSLEIRDVTPPPLLPTEEERWRQVGLSPDGRILDPKHLQ